MDRHPHISFFLPHLLFALLSPDHSIDGNGHPRISSFSYFHRGLRNERRWASLHLLSPPPNYLAKNEV